MGNGSRTSARGSFIAFIGFVALLSILLAVCIWLIFAFKDDKELAIGCIVLSAVPLISLCVVVLMGLVEKQDAERAMLDKDMGEGQPNPRDTTISVEQPSRSSDVEESKAAVTCEFKLTAESSESKPAQAAQGVSKPMPAEEQDGVENAKAKAGDESAD